MHRSGWARIFVLAVVLLASSTTARAKVKLPAIFGNHMVLQRDATVPVWGWAEPGEKVTVAIAGQKVSATADESGKWQVRLQPIEAGGEPLTMTVQGTNTIALTDILIGEVWIGSGQSNMQWAVTRSVNHQKEIAAAEYPKIRLFRVASVVATQPARDTRGKWQACSPKTVPGFSAVAYYFGRHVHKELGVPVGLIQSAWGGTPAESWTPRPAVEADPALKPILDRWNETLEKLPKQQEQFKRRMAQWKTQAAAARAAGKRPPRRPNGPIGPKHPHSLSGLYNGMIAPVVPYGIRGAIWYQGESNARRANEYRALFGVMIGSWREAWGQGDFPFLFVQLANWLARGDRTGMTWAELREAQLQTLGLPNTGMAVTIDIGNPTDIHPRNKQDVGKRLALAALANVYGKDVVYSGPIYESMKVEGEKVRLRFKHLGGGLVAKGSELKGFTISADGKQFVPATATIDGDTVLVGAEGIAKPVAVRYGWSNNPACNLYNKANLPASPFRTNSPTTAQPSSR